MFRTVALALSYPSESGPAAAGRVCQGGAQRRQYGAAARTCSAHGSCPARQLSPPPGAAVGGIALLFENLQVPATRLQNSAIQIRHSVALLQPRQQSIEEHKAEDIISSQVGPRLWQPSFKRTKPGQLSMKGRPHPSTGHSSFQSMGRLRLNHL
jgi:hypothetical protein